MDGFPVATRAGQPRETPPNPPEPITPDPRDGGVTWYVDEDGNPLPGAGTYYDVVAQNIDSIIICADNIDAIIEVAEADDIPYLPLAGGTMEGALALAADAPVGPQDATPKQYVDDFANFADTSYLKVAGGAMTGALALAGDPVNPLEAVPKRYLDAMGIVVGDAPPLAPVNGKLWWDSVGLQLYIFYNDGNSSQWVRASSFSGAPYLPLTGGTLTGPLTLAADPTAPMHATTKRYVDARLSAALTPTMFGAVGDGIADDSVPVQQALDAAQSGKRTFYLPATANGFRVTVPLKITAGLLMDGAGFTQLVTNGVHGIGSWLYFDHPGVGILITPPAGAPDGAGPSGVLLRGIGTMRHQPADGPGWAPGDFDFDIDIVNGDVTINDVMLLNATRGIRIRQPANGYSRLRINSLRADCFKVGIDADQIYTLFQWSNIHFWCWWRDTLTTRAYKLANLTAALIGKVDGIQVTNFFAISCNIGIRFVSTPTGFSQRSMWTNTYIDLCANGIVSEVAGWNTPTFQGLICYSSGGSTGYAINFLGSGNDIVVTNGTFVGFPGAAVNLNGGNANTYKQSGGVFYNNDALASGASNINTTVATDRVYLHGNIRYDLPAAHALVGGPGAWFTWVNADQFGTVTTTRFAVDGAAYLTLSAGNPLLGYDANDYERFVRATNKLEMRIGGTLTRVEGTIPTFADNAAAAAGGVAVREWYVTATGQMMMRMS